MTTETIGQLSCVPACPEREAFLHSMLGSLGTEELAEANDATASCENRSVALKLDDPWFPTVDLNQAKNIILNSSDVIQGTEGYFRSGRIKWPQEYHFIHLTKTDFAPASNRLTDETSQFVRDHDLIASVMWLQTTTPQFFKSADFEIDLLPTEDDEDNLLGLKVYSTFTASEFRERRHGICEVMLEAGHKDLHRIISIFQRRTQSHGWEIFS